MYRIGLKVWSINKNYIKDAVSLYKEGVYDYIELFSVPGSYEMCIDWWKDLDIPYVIHAPHSGCNMNFAKKEFLDSNLKMAFEALKYADTLKAEIVIFHPGVEGDIKETAFQINKINDSRMTIENKPYYALHDNLINNGYSPEDIKFLKESCNIGFCLDIPHAIYSANSQKIDRLSYLEKFIKLNPIIFHIYDGDYFGVYDYHKKFGEGSFSFGEIFKILPLNRPISIETPKKSKENLEDFKQDAYFLKGLFSSAEEIPEKWTEKI
ncbi:hypothetical protein KAW80_00335 [Candidatus Babeliales bacterium]|nr:hypothetical protein [Candidatus Babeliales bacterium]